MTKSSFVHEKLRGQILRDELKPGTYLNIDELARQMGMSPIPIREAVARLAAERLVEIRPHAGASVAPLDEGGVREVFAILEGLEVGIAERLCELATPEACHGLSELLQLMETDAANASADAWDDHNREFHLKLAAIAGMPMVLQILGEAFDRWLRLRRHFFADRDTDRLARSQQEHRRMVSLLREGDAASLEELFKRHNRAARNHYLTSLRKRHAG